MRTYLLVASCLMCGACAASTTETDTSPKTKTYTGTYSAQVVESTVTVSLVGGGTHPCTNTYTMSGTVTMTITESSSSTSLGLVDIKGAQTETAHGGVSSCVAKGNLSTGWTGTLTGTTSALQFAGQTVATNGSYVVTSRTSFTGALSGGVVTGQLGFSVSGVGTIGTGSIVQSYSTTMNVTLN